MASTRQLRVEPTRLAVARLAPETPVPAWAWRGPFTSVTRTPHELSIVCAEDAVPDGVVAERGYVALVVEGPLPFDAVGVLASIAGPLAASGLSILAVCTYDTDYVLVRAGDLPRAVDALVQAGHRVARDGLEPPARSRES